MLAVTPYPTLIVLRIITSYGNGSKEAKLKKKILTLGISHLQLFELFRYSMVHLVSCVAWSDYLINSISGRVRKKRSNRVHTSPLTAPPGHS